MPDVTMKDFSVRPDAEGWWDVVPVEQPYSDELLNRYGLEARIQVRAVGANDYASAMDRSAGVRIVSGPNDS